MHGEEKHDFEEKEHVGNDDGIVAMFKTSTTIFLAERLILTIIIYVIWFYEST